MDEKKDKDQIEHSDKRYPDSTRIGKWIIEVNDPFGFVVRHSQSPEEFHFFKDANNGWLTSVSRIILGKPTFNTFNARGDKGCMAPILCDKVSNERAYKIAALKEKLNEDTITSEEKDELLNLLKNVV